MQVAVSNIIGQKSNGARFAVKFVCYAHLCKFRIKIYAVVEDVRRMSAQAEEETYGWSGAKGDG